VISACEIVTLDSAHEALLLRAILESLGLRVGMTLAGSPHAFVDSLAIDTDFTILCGHGDENGFVFGEFGSGIDTSWLVGGSMPAEGFQGVRIGAKTVISTACRTGTEAFATAFGRAGVNTYMAPHGYPDGAAVPLILHRFFHAMRIGGRDAQSALEHAQNDLGPEDRFTSFKLH